MPITRRLLGVLALGLAGASLAPALSSVWWVFELPSHFRVQSIAAALALAGLLLLHRAWALVAASLGLVGVHALAMLPLWLPEPVTATPDAPRLGLLVANVYTANRNHEAVIALVERLKPDLVGLLEVDEGWLRRLAELERWYPYRVDRPQANNFGIALLSRFPLEAEIRPLLHPDVPFIVARTTLSRQPVAIALAHPVPPSGSAATQLRNRQLAALARVRSELADHEFVLLGDLNTSPWSPAFERLTRVSGLRNAARGFGFAPTWPTHLPLLMTTIDLCLLSSGLEALEHRTGPEMGSDHLPLYVEIATRTQDARALRQGASFASARASAGRALQRAR